MVVLGLAIAVAGCGSASPSRTVSNPAAGATRPVAPSRQVERAFLATLKTARACITRHGLRVSGGPIYPQDSPTSPDGELIVGSSKGGAYVAFYVNVTRAEQLESLLTETAKHLAGQVERRGAETVLLIHHPAARLRDAVIGCAFD
jgi:hypothetical protein